ncbi:MAG: uracil-DNA glycosylase [Thermoplasmata archaeon]|nr:MAG: uracil-DNA glycosylase [Thermoplasmata archaeon]
MEELKKIEDEIKKCKKCSLCLTRKNAVPGEGKYDAYIMMIGEAPGKNEDEQGRPFVGKAGKFLDFALSTINLEREKIYITNVVKCRPPNNRDPTTEEIKACSPYLDAQINLIQPRIICTLGRFATEYILPSYGFTAKPISQIHGKIFYSPIAMVHIIPLYHPAASIYIPAIKEIFLKDIKSIPSILNKDES